MSVDPYKLHIPDPPSDVTDDVREWMQAVTDQLVIITNANRKAADQRCPTVAELKAAGISGAENL